MVFVRFFLPLFASQFLCHSCRLGYTPWFPGNVLDGKVHSEKNWNATWFRGKCLRITDEAEGCGCESWHTCFSAKALVPKADSQKRNWNANMVSGKVLGGKSRKKVKRYMVFWEGSWCKGRLTKQNWNANMVFWEGSGCRNATWSSGRNATWVSMFSGLPFFYCISCRCRLLGGFGPGDEFWPKNC